MKKDGLVEVHDDKIIITEIGKDFAQFITNRFDVYDPPNKSYSDRLETIKKAKQDQEMAKEYAKNL